MLSKISFHTPSNDSRPQKLPVQNKIAGHAKFPPHRLHGKDGSNGLAKIKSHPNTFLYLSTYRSWRVESVGM